MTTPLQEALERIAREHAAPTAVRVSTYLWETLGWQPPVPINLSGTVLPEIDAALREYGALVAEMACKAVCGECAAGVPVYGASHVYASGSIKTCPAFRVRRALALPEPQR